MESKLHNLTEKIYREGIEKANLEREKIIEDTKREASAIISAAREEAEGIRKTAEIDAEELRQNVIAGLKVAGIQALSLLKQQIKDLVTAKALEEPARALFLDAEFLKELIIAIVRNSNMTEGVELTLAPNLQEKMDAAIIASIRKEVGALAVIKDQKLPEGFTIAPHEGTYKIAFTDSDFIEFFRPYVRDKAEKILFEKEQV